VNLFDLIKKIKATILVNLVMKYRRKFIHAFFELDIFRFFGKFVQSAMLSEAFPFVIEILAFIFH